MENILRIYRTFWESGTNFKGQTSRNDFWLAIWCHVIIYVLILADIMMYKQRLGVYFGLFVFVLYTLALIAPLLSLITRRYNDLGLPRYWMIITVALPIVLLLIGMFTGNVAFKVFAWVIIIVGIVILALPKDEFVRKNQRDS